MLTVGEPVLEATLLAGVSSLGLPLAAGSLRRVLTDGPAAPSDGGGGGAAEAA